MSKVNLKNSYGGAKTMKDAAGPCIICNGGISDMFYKLYPYPLVKCSSCGLVRLSALPPEEERRKASNLFYSSNHYIKTHFKNRRFIKHCFRYKLKIIEGLKPQKGRILDIGCSFGFFLDEAKKQGWDVHGVEVNPGAGDYIKNRFGSRVFIGELQASNFKKHSFDVITLWDVIEHMRDPAGFLINIKSYLKESGLLCIQTPNIESYVSRFKNKNWDSLTPGDHLYFFSPDSLGRILNKAGFKPVYFNTWEPYLYFVETIIGFREKNNFLILFYRRVIVRALRIIFFFIFIPMQRIMKKKRKGALIESFVIPK